MKPLKGEFAKPYYRKLFATVNEEYKTRLIFPPAKDIFNAFHLTPLKDVKVVILGQDPIIITAGTWIVLLGAKGRGDSTFTGEYL